MPLSAIAVKNAKANGKPYKLADFAGLYLYVSPQGSRLWRFDYRFAGKRKTASFGAFPDVSLVDARERRDAARKLLKDGRDPMTVKQAERARINGNVKNSFETIGRAWYERRKARWSQRYGAQLLMQLETMVFPDLGNRPIGEIEPPELLRVIRKIENRPALSTARLMNQTCGQIFRFAIVEGMATRDPSRDLAGALTTPPAVKHYTALSAADLPAFYSRLDAYQGHEQVRLALEMTLLCFTRAEEACQAEWSEFEDLDGKAPLWRVPAARMKTKHEHLIPLAPQAVEVLRRAKELAGDSPKVFALPNTFGVVRRFNLLRAVYSMGFKGGATTHGLRRTASTILHERGFEPDHIEVALAHRIGGIRGVYNAARYLDQRREMLTWWAEYLAGARRAGALI